MSNWEGNEINREQWSRKLVKLQFYVWAKWSSANLAGCHAQSMGLHVPPVGVRGTAAMNKHRRRTGERGKGGLERLFSSGEHR